MTDEVETLVVEAEIDAAPEKVWRALIEPALREAWLGSPPADDGSLPSASSDGEFIFDDEGRRVDGEIVEAEAPNRLRWRWREQGGGVGSEVAFTLTPTRQGGTHVRIVHAPVVVSLARRRTRALARSRSLASYRPGALARAA
jgi:uncharacterized protein YndB with AHSA1/START domain